MFQCRRAAAKRALSATTKPPCRQRRKLAPRRPRTRCARCSLRPEDRFGTQRARLRMTDEGNVRPEIPRCARNDGRRQRPEPNTKSRNLRTSYGANRASFGATAASRPEVSGRDAEAAPQDDGKSECKSRSFNSTNLIGSSRRTIRDAKGAFQDDD